MNDSATLTEKTQKISPFLFPGKAVSEHEETVSENDLPNDLDLEFPELRKIGLIVAPFFEFCLRDIHKPTKTRKSEIVETRQIAMFFSRIFTKYSLTAIGQYYGMKNHATVLHAVEKINNLAETDKEFKSDINELYRKIKDQLNIKDDEPYKISKSDEKFEVHIMLGKSFKYEDMKRLNIDLIKMDIPDDYTIIIL